jgi:hypothetical protein
MIVPTIGRVVWFYTAPGAEQQAAIITKVRPDGKINVAVFDEYGTNSGRVNVYLAQDEASTPKTGAYCAWMPYQIGQAKKHAEEERAP